MCFFLFFKSSTSFGLILKKKKIYILFRFYCPRLESHCVVQQVLELLIMHHFAASGGGGGGRSSSVAKRNGKIDLIIVILINNGFIFIHYDFYRFD
jgi:hypothetical protein